MAVSGPDTGDTEAGEEEMEREDKAEAEADEVEKGADGEGGKAQGPSGRFTTPPFPSPTVNRGRSRDLLEEDDHCVMRSSSAAPSFGVAASGLATPLPAPPAPHFPSAS